MSTYDRFFQLREGEKIIYESKPEKSYRWLVICNAFTGLLLLFTFLTAVVVYVIGRRPSPDNPLYIAPADVFIILVVLVFPAFVISVVTGSLTYRQRYHWITNMRVVVKTGMVGYSVKVVPLERISDVLISKSFAEKVFGVSSLQFETLAGQSGTECVIRGIKDPENVQSHVFSLLKKRRETAGITF